MEENTAVRMENVMGWIAESDAFYQETKQKSPDCIRGNIPINWIS